MKKIALFFILSIASLSFISFAAASGRQAPAGSQSVAFTIKVDVSDPRSRQVAMSAILYGIEEWNRGSRFTGKMAGKMSAHGQSNFSGMEAR